MKRLLICGFLGLVCVILFTVRTVIAVRGGYEYERIVFSFWTLADRQSTIAAKGVYMDKFVEALKAQHLDGTYNAIIYPTPDNAFDTNYAALLTLQARLHDIEKMDVTSFQYQTAIQQITAQEQGEAKPMLDVFEGCWWKARYSIFLWDWVNALCAGVLLVFGGICGMVAIWGAAEHFDWD